MNTVIAFIFMFGLLVFIHEFGHLIFAKRAGMLVREFAIGFGPKIFPFVKNETLYTIRLLPIGGYVRVAGEDPEIVDINPGQHVGLEFNEAGKVTRIIINNKSKHPYTRIVEVERADLDHDLVIEGYEPNEYDEKLIFPVDRNAMYVMDERETQIAPYDRQFASKTKSQRAMQLFAGPMMNFLLAIVLFFILGMLQGVPAETAKVSNIQAGSPAAAAGLKDGDEIVKVGTKDIANWTELQQAIQAHPKEELDLIAIRDGKTMQLQVVPAEKEIEGKKIGRIGVEPATEKSVMKTIKYGFQETYGTTKLIVTNIGMLVTGQYSLDMLSGPVGIYDVTDKVVQDGFTTFLKWTAMLSINLGIVNLLPLPALDGGRLLFVGIEAVRGKPMDPQKEGIVHFVGFALIMLLMIVVTWNDIQRLFM